MLFVASALLQRSFIVYHDCSKTMIGYGDEDTQFVLELTYNYGEGAV
jgi:hypothetical protein